ncbi:DNA repair protein RecO [Spirochaetota bacterium]
MLHAILLTREKTGDYNEKLTFFTREKGILSVYGFGTRSMRSSRGKALASYDFLSIEVEKSKKGFALKNARIENKLAFLSDLDLYNFFLKLLRVVYGMLPFELKEENIFTMLSSIASFLQSGERTFEALLLIFNSSMLRELGWYPYFSSCGHCGLKDAENFTYNVLTNEYTCIHCIPRSVSPGNEAAQKNAEHIHLAREDIPMINVLYEKYASADFDIIQKAYNEIKSNICAGENKRKKTSIDRIVMLFSKIIDEKCNFKGKSHR